MKLVALKAGVFEAAFQRDGRRPQPALAHEMGERARRP